MYIVESIFIFIFSILFVYLLKKYAFKLGLVDVPNDRSTHVKHMPRGAGIGFFIAVAILLPVMHASDMISHFWIFLAILMVFTIGVLDDIKEASPNLKFVVLILGTMLLSFDGIIIEDLGTFFGLHITLGIFALPFTIFAVVGFTNALNLIDGLDGLAASISIVILGGLFSIGYSNDDQMMMILSGAFISTLCAFLIFNWHPASIFMGDSGSLVLGFVIALLFIKSAEYIPTVSVLFLGAIPIIDTVTVMIRRKRNGRSLFSADKCHAHHVMFRFFNGDTKKTVIFFIIFQSIYTITGLQNKDADEGLLLVVFILNIMLVFMMLVTMINRQKEKC